MTNYEKLARLAIDKSLLKEYSNSSDERIVYMDNNTEFQIQIFNPYSYTIGVRFEFNEKSSYNYQLLVLRPGERVWLDRYLDKPSKLLFTTYEVGTSEDVKKAIVSNGKINIKFYKEREISVQTYQITSSNVWTGPNILYSRALDNCVLEHSTGGNRALNSDINFYNSTCTATEATSNAQYTSTTTASCGNNELGLCNYNYKDATQISCKPKSNKMETGRIENGSHSNQEFNTVNNEFESWPFKTEIIQILPSSRKPVTSQDLEKKYCYNCGRKLNQKFKFCPFCGAKQ